MLIRGPAGAGKSQLALKLIQAAPHGPLAIARLVADDRVHVLASNGRLIARPPAAIAGLLEIRGIGIRRVPYEPMAVISLVVDLDAVPADRMPDAAASVTNIDGLCLPRLAVAPGCDPFPLVLATLTFSPLSAVAANPNDAVPADQEGHSLPKTRSHVHAT